MPALCQPLEMQRWTRFGLCFPEAKCVTIIIWVRITSTLLLAVEFIPQAWPCVEPFRHVLIQKLRSTILQTTNWDWKVKWTCRGVSKCGFCSESGLVEPTVQKTTVTVCYSQFPRGGGMPRTAHRNAPRLTTRQRVGGKCGQEPYIAFSLGGNR